MVREILLNSINSFYYFFISFVSRFSDNVIFKRISSLDYFLIFLLFNDLAINYLFEYVPQLIVKNSYKRKAYIILTYISFI